MSKHRTGVALAAIAAAWACGVPARAASVDLALRVQTAAGEEVEPVTPGVWNVPLGYDFKVVLSARVTNPNTFTETTPGGTRTYPLGLSGLGTDLISSAARVVDPALQPYQMVSGVRVWQSEDFTGWGFPWFNAIDYEGDGDLDPLGVGFNMIGLVGRQPSGSNEQLRLAIDEFADITRGGYSASHVGTTLLQTHRNNPAQVFYYGTNFPELPARLLADYALTTDATIAINVVETTDGWEGARNVSVPEPGAVLAATGAAGLLARRRRIC